MPLSLELDWLLEMRLLWKRKGCHLKVLGLFIYSACLVLWRIRCVLYGIYLIKSLEGRTSGNIMEKKIILLERAVFFHIEARKTERHLPQGIGIDPRESAQWGL